MLINYNLLLFYKVVDVMIIGVALWSAVSSPPVLSERDITFVSGTADIRARRAPRIIYGGPRREMERGEKACDRRIISASLPPSGPHAV